MGAGQRRRYTEAPEPGGDRPPGQPVGVTLTGKTCAACSGTVPAGDRAIRLLCSGGVHVLHNRCVLHRVERTPAGNLHCCPVESWGAWHSRDFVLIDVTRADLGVWGRALVLREPPVRDASAIPLHGVSFYTGNIVNIRASFDQYNVATFATKFYTIGAEQPPYRRYD